jgi:Uma2 family endonuclease
MAVGTLLTLAQFERLPEDGMRHELSEGELIKVVHPKFGHSAIVRQLRRSLERHVEKQELGEVHTELGHLLTNDPPTVRVPDLSFLSRERVGRTPRDEWVRGAPELAVEVVSPSESAEDLNQKVMQYLAAGAQAVWVIYPKTKVVQVYRPGMRPEVLESSQLLEEPRLFPGWSIAVGDLFPD